MGLIETHGKLSVVGENLVGELLVATPVAAVKSSDDFEEFWKLYPATDEFRHFPKTRQLRWNKQLTRTEYELALAKASHEEIMAGLRGEIAFRQDSQTENLFKYMKSSVNWLRSEYWNEHTEAEEKGSLHGKEIS